MKILQLRFKNLNSLYGEWQIDFTHSNYDSDGIFALTGPTGAGKSTILDAICLALYAETPRLGKITKNNNEIISKKTTECYSEVVLQTQEGVYRVHWAQHRSHNRIDGTLQTPRHEIAHFGTNRIIDSKISQVPNIVEQKTGMDFNRFTRAVLLAQGQFDQFLKANTEQKSEILEQITGTDIYSEISIQVFKRYKEEKEKLQQIKDKINLIKVLDSHKEETLRKDLQQHTNNIESLQEKIKSVEVTLGWLKGVTNLRLEIQEINTQIKKLDLAIQNFAPQKEHLDWAQKAKKLSISYQYLRGLQRKIKSNKKELQEKSTELDKTKSLLENDNQILSKQTLKLKQAQSDYHKKIKLFTEVRHIDNKLQKDQGIIHQIQNDLNTNQKDLENLNQKLTDISQKLWQSEQSLNTLNDFLDRHQSDESLTKELNAIEQNITLLHQKQENHKKYRDQEKIYWQQITDKAKEIDPVIAQYDDKVRSQESIKTQIKKLNQELQYLLAGQSLAFYRKQKESLLLQANKIQDLDIERNQLIDGEPCPLCGATHHPYKINGSSIRPEINNTIETLNQLIQQAESLKDNIDDNTQILQKIFESKTKIELKNQELNQEYRDLLNKQANIQHSINLTESEIKQLTEKIANGLQIYNTPFDATQSSVILTSLKSRVTLWESKKKERNDVERIMQEQFLTQQTIQIDLKHKKQRIQNLKEQYDELYPIYTQNYMERKGLLGQDDPNILEQQLEQDLHTLEEDHRSMTNKIQSSKEKAHILQGNIESLKKEIGSNEDEFVQEKNSFSWALQEQGFRNLKHFLNSVLTDEEINRLLENEKNIYDQKNNLTTQYKDRSERLAQELEKNMTNDSIDTLNSRIKIINTEINNTNQIIGSIKTQLKTNEDAKQYHQKEQGCLQLQQQEFEKWDLLCNLIGSADGKKYRNFAQSLTFELMVANANIQLQKMNDRYLLIQSKQTPLTLDVIDNYQAGEMRSSKNLSGGESFLVSLALALGLSNMTSQKFKVDSLFLDEGFGTLDEDTLDAALETLAKLKQENKLIGIISHVPVLKDRIMTQIEVKPNSGGKSILKGPGVKRF
ncbi:MAG: AAA family ATPase [Neisseriaceae bacterium]|nr:MAG: AAA family ATPase [Neisseriaceae bacterium]